MITKEDWSKVVETSKREITQAEIMVKLNTEILRLAEFEVNRAKSA